MCSAWQPPPFASKNAGEPPRCQWILSEEPAVVMRHLRPLLESAKRSMLVAVENCTPVTLELDKQHTTSIPAQEAEKRWNL